MKGGTEEEKEEVRKRGIKGGRKLAWPILM